MYTPIDDDAALEVSETRRMHAERHVHHRDLARFYGSDRHGLDPEVALARMEVAANVAVDHTIRESACLHTLNDLLLNLGVDVGEECLVGRSLYRVSNPGRFAAYLGEAIPTDELHTHYEGLDNAGDEAAEDRSEHADSTRMEG